MSRSIIKWWVLCTSLPLTVTVRQPYPRGGDIQDQEKFLAPFLDRQTLNYDIECSNHYLSLSTLRPKELSPSKIKWWDIYTNLQLRVIVGPPHPWSGDNQDQEMFLAPFVDKELRNYDIPTSNHHPSLSTLRPKGFSRHMIKW